MTLETLMAGLHPETARILGARYQITAPTSGGGNSPNQRDARFSRDLWDAYHRGVRTGDWSDFDADCEALLWWLDGEAKDGYLYGEADDTYGAKWRAQRVLAFAALDAAFAAGHRSARLQAAWDRIINWFRGMDTVTEAWAFPGGEGAGQGPRHKHGGAVQGNVRGCDEWEAWMRGAAGYIAERMAEPLDSPWWSQKGRAHERLLRWLLEGEDGSRLRGYLGPKVWPRTAHPTWWRSDPDGSLAEIVCPWVRAQTDGSGKVRDAQMWWRWTALGYVRETQGVPVTGVNILWSALDPDIALSYRHIQGVRGGERLPHPNLGAEWEPADPAEWSFLGPASPIPTPEPVPWQGEGGRTVAAPPPTPPPDDPDPVPQWLVRKWLLEGGAPEWATGFIPGIVWQSRHLAQGKPNAERRLKAVVKAMEKARKGKG